MKKPPLNTHWFEKWAAKNCMRPVCKVSDPDGEILLADSIEPIRVLGKYRTGYAILRDDLKFGNYNDYDMQEFVLYSREGGVQKRVNEALTYARAMQSELKQSGFYDGEAKGRFSQRQN
jgi:hypothetical protein